MKRYVTTLAPLLLLLIIALPITVQASYFTAPVNTTGTGQISSWFDHDYPDYSTTGQMHRHDGAVFSGSSAAPGTCTNGAGCYDGHNGIDFAVASGTDAIAVADGEVIDVDYNTCGGWTVWVWHNDLGLTSLYGHVATTTVGTTSDQVDRYEHIAEVNSTGTCSTGPHLHFGVIDGNSAGDNRIDPFGWTGTTTDPWPYNLGYLWTTNPLSMFAPANLPSGLISVWLSDSSGLTSDLKGSNSLTNNNSASLLSNGGKNGDAGSFDRSSAQYLEDTSLTGWHNGANSFSYSGWFKVPPMGGGEYHTILSSTISGTGTRNFAEVQLNPSGQVKFEVSGTGGFEFYTPAANYDDDTWHHFAAVAKNSAGLSYGELYIDGSLNATSTSPTLGYDFASSLTRFRIGSTYNWYNGLSQHHLNGIVHQAAVWHRALTSTEVSELYNSGSGIYYSGF